MIKNTPKKVIKNIKTSGIEIIYTFFLSILITLFFGLGISAFYTSPEPPEYPKVLSMPTKDILDTQTQEQIDAQINFDKANEDYAVVLADYNQKVSIITLILAVSALAISLIFLGNIYVLSNGLLLGGVFTLIYSMIRGFMADNNQYRFIIVSIGLLITLALGYIKFIKSNRQEK